MIGSQIINVRMRFQIQTQFSYTAKSASTEGWIIGLNQQKEILGILKYFINAKSSSKTFIVKSEKTLFLK